MSEGKKSKGMANLTPWKKGQSGNPGGVPKAVREFNDTCRRALVKELRKPTKFDPEGKTTRLQAVISRLVDAAEGGEIAAVREIFDRLIGKPKQSIEATGDGDGGPIRVVVIDAKVRPETKPALPAAAVATIEQDTAPEVEPEPAPAAPRKIVFNPQVRPR